MWQKLKPVSLHSVVMDIMSTQMSEMSIEQAAAHFKVSQKTIRRRITAGTLKVSRRGRRVYVHVPGQNVHNVRSKSKQNVHSPDETIKRQQSEIDHLREQVDKLTSLLALQSKQNSDLIAQLPKPRPAFTKQIGSLFTRLIGSPE